MEKIRSKNTGPEIFVRSLLHRNGFRFTVSDSEVFGKPDLFFSKRRVAMFVHGCYWHRHTGCKFAYTPKSNVDFWQAKFHSNVLRDEAVKTRLLKDGIRILIIWECTVKKAMNDDDASEKLLMEMKSFLLQADADYLEL